MKMSDSDRKGPDALLTGDRRSFLRASLLAGGALAAHSLSRRTSFVAAESNSLLATTKAGMVRGAVEDGIIVFKGVPYGAPPTGALRFMPPVPPAPWTGVRDALQFGDRCPQVSAPSSPAWRSWDRQTGESEDCLVLNVWTPALRDGRRRPVMVWFHGGGFTSGSGSDTVYDGARLCQRQRCPGDSQSPPERLWLSIPRRVGWRKIRRLGKRGPAQPRPGAQMGTRQHHRIWR